MTVWSQRLLAGWPTSLDYWDRRVAIGRQFEDSGFQLSVSAEAILGHTPDRSVQIELQDQSLTLVAYGTGSIPTDLPYRVIDVVSEAVSMRSLAFRVRLGALIPLDLSYDEAKTQVWRGSTSESLEDLGIKDFSLLLDLPTSKDIAAHQAELGVLSADEVPQRLLMEVGRIGKASTASRAHSFEWASVPKTSFFADVMKRWSPQKSPSDAGKTLKAAWQDAADSTELFMADLGERLHLTTKQGES